MGSIIGLDRSNLEFLSAPVKITPRTISTAVYPNPTFSSSVANLENLSLIKQPNVPALFVEHRGPMPGVYALSGSKSGTMAAYLDGPHYRAIVFQLSDLENLSLTKPNVPALFVEHRGPIPSVYALSGSKSGTMAAYLNGPHYRAIVFQLSDLENLSLTKQPNVPALFVEHRGPMPSVYTLSGSKSGTMAAYFNGPHYRFRPKQS